MGVPVNLRAIATLCLTASFIAPDVAHAAVEQLCAKSHTIAYDRPIDLTAETLDGPNFVLQHDRGKTVVLHLFATWCGPCKYEMPEVLRLARQYKDEGLSVVLMDVGDSDNSVRRFRKKFGITLPIAMDRHEGFAEAIERGDKPGSVFFPTTLFISPDGFLMCYVPHMMDATDWQAELYSLLPATPATPAASPTPIPAGP